VRRHAYRNNAKPWHYPSCEGTDSTPQELEQELDIAIRDIVIDIAYDKSKKKVERKHAQIDHASQ
jgi:hypothetical protein